MDLYRLYESAVMSPEADVEFMTRLYKRYRGKPARRFREDFCQTGLLACEFAKRHSENHAWGLDLDPKPLAWSKKNHLQEIGKAAERVHLCRQNVLHAKTPQVDIICALNFSYFVFRERKLLVEYFKAAHRDLRKGGIFYLDILGGPEAQELVRDETREKHFTYIWDQAAFNPITHEYFCYIHFKIHGGKTIKKAFTYHWRLWSITEVTDALTEAGFKVEIYWEDENKKGEGTGSYRIRKNPPNTIAWVAFIVGVK